MTLAECDALIATVAARPKSGSNNMGSVEQHSLADLLKLREQLVSATVDEVPNENGGPVSGWNSLRPARAVPPGTF